MIGYIILYELRFFTLDHIYRPFYVFTPYLGKCSMIMINNNDCIKSVTKPGMMIIMIREHLTNYYYAICFIMIIRIPQSVVALCVHFYYART